MSNALYDFYYQYNDGNFYYGTVSSNSSYGYYTGEKVTESNGYYYIYANGGTTNDAAGTVHTTYYYDSTSAKGYTPYYGTDGYSGLGSEYDYTYGAKGFQEYGGGGKYEAKQGSNTLFDYEYVYKDGSYYYGTVSSDYSHGNYYTGEKISGSDGGYYYVYYNAGNTSQTAGTVHTTSYFDSTSHKYYTPYYTGYGYADGSSGLGSEYDWTYGAQGYQEFGGSGKYEAKQGSKLFDYEYIYSDGSYYYGTVSSDASHGNYYTGEKISGSNGGHYYIYYDAGYTSQTAGTVHTTSYSDSASHKYYTPYYTGLGYADGSSGLGSEYDYTFGAKGYQLFGQSGKYEAKQA